MWTEWTRCCAPHTRIQSCPFLWPRQCLFPAFSHLYYFSATAAAHRELHFDGGAIKDTFLPSTLPGIVKFRFEISFEFIVGCRARLNVDDTILNSSAWIPSSQRLSRCNTPSVIPRRCTLKITRIASGIVFSEDRVASRRSLLFEYMNLSYTCSAFEYVILSCIA